MMENQQPRKNKAGPQSKFAAKSKHQSDRPKFKKIFKNNRNQNKSQGPPNKYSHSDKGSKKFDKPHSSSNAISQKKDVKAAKQIPKIQSNSSPKPKGNEQLPTIQSMLQIPTEKRQQKTTQYFKKVRPFLESFLQKKIGSRVVQLMFKWGNKQVKQQIHKVVSASWKDLIKSKYALHSIATVSAEYDFPRIVDDAILLQNNKEGSMLLEDHMAKHPSRCGEILQKFSEIAKKYGEKGLQSQEPLHNLAIKSIQKGYYANRISKHIIKLALQTMIEEERTKIKQFFADKVFELFQDEEGVKLFVHLFNYFQSKQKKAIVKLISGQVAQVVKMCKVSYVVIIKICTDTDDTVLVGNNIIPQLIQLFVQPTASNTEMEEENQEGEARQTAQPNSQRVLNIIISLLSPRTNNFNCLGKMQKIVPFTTCKKPEQKRKQQIRQFIYPALVEYITKEQNIEKMIGDFHLSKLPLGVLKSMQEDSSEHLKDYVTRLLNYFISDVEKHQIKNSKKIKIVDSLAANNFGSKLLKNILLVQQAYIDKYCDKFAEIFKNNLENTVNSNASFVLTILIEKGRNELIEQIKRAKIDLSKAKAANFYLERLRGKGK